MITTALLLLTAYLLLQFFSHGVTLLNLSHMRRSGVLIPAELSGFVDVETLHRAQTYETDKARFGIGASLFDTTVTVVFLFGGLMAWYDGWVRSFGLPFISEGLVFALLLSIAGECIDIPFSLYGTFRIEARHGFNTMTLRTWLLDFVKSLLISLVIMAFITAVALWLVQASPEHWWLWVWLFLLGFSLFVMYIAPYVIEPLFNKFEPVKDEVLAGEIIELCARAGIRASKVQQMDASKRSRHSNAYFTGIGRVKRIVLYDTLIAQMTHAEIVSVLAHEIGHWKKRHILKSLVLMQLFSFAGLYVAYQLVQGNALGQLFGMDVQTLMGKFVLLSFAVGIVMFPLKPLMLVWSRHNEREADRFSFELTGNSESMATSLIKLSKENLSNLYPHPLYVAMHYSHPPIVERVRTIRSFRQAQGS
jgi:STE24 endopeptidase